jgi:hypothetical protein
LHRPQAAPSRGREKASGEGGIRTTRVFPEEPALPADRGAQSGAPATQTRPADPDLAALVVAWPNLPEPIKAGILAMIRAAGG